MERYRGALSGLLKSKVSHIDTPNPQRVRIVLQQPWADFMTFCASPATGASWIVPKRHVEKVGDDGFKKAAYPDIDGLFAEQVNEQNPRVRKQLLDRAQQLIYERLVFIPVMGSVFLNGVGSRATKTWS